MEQIYGAAIVLAVTALVAGILLVKERKRKRLFKDDGFVWNTAIEKRMKEESNGKRTRK